MSHCKVDEHTRVRDAEEKKNLLHRQIPDIYPREIVGIESPDANVREKVIPYDKNNRRDNYGNCEMLPLFVERRLGIEAC